MLVLQLSQTTFSNDGLSGLVQFSDRYVCHFTYQPWCVDEPIVLRKRESDSRSWSINPRPSPLRIEALLRELPQHWEAARAKAFDDEVDARAWADEKRAFEQKRRAGPRLYDALRRLLAHSSDPNSHQVAILALAEAEGRGLTKYAIFPDPERRSRHVAYGMRWDDVLADYQLSLPVRPRLGAFHIEEIGEAD